MQSITPYHIKAAQISASEQDIAQEGGTSDDFRKKLNFSKFIRVGFLEVLRIFKETLHDRANDDMLSLNDTGLVVVTS